MGGLMKRLSVLGTFVWDTIYHPDRGALPLEQWGGIAYSLSAFAAACPAGWCIHPIIRVGSDLLPEARKFVATLPNICADHVLAESPEPNNRVELRYFDAAERRERLTGGVGPWDPDVLLPHLAGTDALFINYLSGYELDLWTAELVRRTVAVPIYADLHSLCLGPPGEGPREPRPLADSGRWIRTADYIQVNEAELALIGGKEMVEREASDELVLLTTRGAAGASCWRIGGAGSDADEFIVSIDRGRDGDPTGCGDVWGAVAFSGLLEGLPLARAMERANFAAAAKLAHQRMDGLAAAIARVLP